MSKENFKPTLLTLEELFKHIYSIPVYQRPYSWGKEQIQVLINDIFEVFNKDDEEIKNEGYYTGNIIVFDKGDKIKGTISKYDVVDGQQRITTFSIILLSIYSLAHINKIPETDKTLTTIKECLWKFIRRDCKKDLRAITLGSIEKECFQNLYNQCFDEPTKVLKFCENYCLKTEFDKRIIENFIFVFNKINQNIVMNKNEENLLDFADYLLQYIQFIFIEANCNENKVFSMFESLNSKGKKLEDIDLIKTYIFSKLDEDSYEYYLDLWGQLIIKTEDKLYDYLYTYIKAYITFYRTNISVNNFKTTCQKEIIKYFNAENECEAFKKMLQDMYNKVEFYKMLNDINLTTNLIKSTKLKFYYKVFLEFSYNHPKGLIFRTLIDYYENNLRREDAIDIIVECIVFLIKVLGISKKESKEVISTFSELMKRIYKYNILEIDFIRKSIANSLIKQGINNDKLKRDLMSLDVYSQNKNLSSVLLSLYEATEIYKNGDIKVSYDQAYTLLNTFGDTFSLDHLLPQTPNKKSKEYKYYKDTNKNVLGLKEGHDFPSTVFTGMEYHLFVSQILNKIGNLRLYYKDKNSSRQNNPIQLKDYGYFNCYKNIKVRNEEIANLIIEKCLTNIN